MRKVVTAILAGSVAAAAVVAAAPPAVAKCGHGTGFPCPDPVQIEATIYDPTWRPIVIRGRDAWRMLNLTGVNYRPFRVYDEPPARLGPRYQVIYRITSGGRIWALYQDLYPYAAGRPFAYTLGGQRFMDRYEEPVEGGHGWRGSRTLESILRAHGLPGTPPSDTTASAAGVVGLPRNGGGGPRSWAWLAAGAALLGLGGLAARRRFRRRPAGTPA